MPNVETLKIAIKNKNSQQVKLLTSQLKDFYLNMTFLENGYNKGFLHLAVDTGDVSVVTELLKYGVPRGLSVGLRTDGSNEGCRPILNYFFFKAISRTEEGMSILYALLAYGARLEASSHYSQNQLQTICCCEAILRQDLSSIKNFQYHPTLDELTNYCEITTKQCKRRKIQGDEVNTFIANWYNPGNDVVEHKNKLRETKALLLNPKYFDVTHSASSRNSVRELEEIIAELIYHRGDLSTPLIGEAYCKYQGLEEEPATRKSIYSYENLSNYLRSPLEVLIADIRCKPGIAAAIEELAKNPYTGVANRSLCNTIMRKSEDLSAEAKLSIEMQRRVIEAASQTKTELSKVKRKVHRQEKRIKKLIQSHEAKDLEVQQLKNELARLKMPTVAPEKSEIVSNSLFAKTHIKRYSM